MIQTHANPNTTTTTTRPRVKLVDGKKYKDSTGVIHTITKITSEESIRICESNVADFLLRAALGLTGAPKWEVPDERPELFESDKSDVFYMGFRNGVCGILNDDDINDPFYGTITGAFLVEEVVEEKITPVNLPLVEGKTYVTRSGRKATNGKLVTGCGGSLVIELDVQGDIPRDYDPLTGKHRYGEYGLDIVSEVAQQEETKASPSHLNLPLVSGKKYRNRRGEVVTVEFETWDPDSVWGDTEGGHRRFSTQTGKHYYGDEQEDLISEVSNA